MTGQTVIPVSIKAFGSRQVILKLLVLLDGSARCGYALSHCRKRGVIVVEN